MRLTSAIEAELDGLGICYDIWSEGMQKRVEKCNAHPAVLD